MFRDAQEELERLEQLLEAEDREEQDPVDEELSDSEEEEPEVFRNYANNYGGKVYNADRTDVDLEDYSREVREPKSQGVSWLVALVFLLFTGIVIMLGLLGLKVWGVL